MVEVPLLEPEAELLPVAEAEAEAEALPVEFAEPLPALMTKGNEYWKTVESESRLIRRP